MADIVQKSQTFDQWRVSYNNFANEWNTWDITAEPVILDIQAKAQPKTISPLTGNTQDEFGHTHAMVFPDYATDQTFIDLQNAAQPLTLNYSTLNAQTVNGHTHVLDIPPLNEDPIFQGLEAKAVPKTLGIGTANAADAFGHTHQVTFPVTQVAGKTGAVTLDSLSAGTGLSGTAYNGSTARSFSVVYGTSSTSACRGDDARLSDSREWTGATVDQVEAETGTATTRRAWTAQRIRQAILAWWNGSAAKSKLDSIATGAQVNVPTNLGVTGTGDTRTITSSTGSDVTVPVASTTLAGFMSRADKSKLNGIAAGAQVNVATNLGISAGTTSGPVVTSSTGSNATLPTASGSASGVVTTGSQTWAGTKTFSSAIVLSTAGTATTHAVRCDRNIATGDGLTGGGNLTANRTFTVDSTVIRTTGNQTLGGIKTFSSPPLTSSTSLARGFKNATISASAPSGGANGDVWLQF